ncbi:MAG: hypothetical protein FGM23_06985 [Alphaproteobacteria bacterium]|nr:hypothetical protein [Alphaproteobacteria bacterium]
MKPTKTLQTLIRLNQLKLDNQRRTLVDLQNKEQHLMTAQQRLEAEQAAENQLMASFAGTDFSAYRQHLKSRQHYVAHQQKETAERIVTVKDQVIDQFREVKTFEIADSNRQDQWHKHLDAKDVRDSDDRTTMRWGYNDIPLA